MNTPHLSLHRPGSAAAAAAAARRGGAAAPLPPPAEGRGSEMGGDLGLVVGAGPEGEEEAGEEGQPLAPPPGPLHPHM